MKRKNTYHKRRRASRKGTRGSKSHILDEITSDGLNRYITISKKRRNLALFQKPPRDGRVGVIIPADHDDNTVTYKGESNVTSIRINRSEEREEWLYRSISQRRGSIGNNPRNNGSLGMK